MKVVSLRVHTVLSHVRVHFFKPALQLTQDSREHECDLPVRRRMIRHCDAWYRGATLEGHYRDVIQAPLSALM